MEPRLEFVLLVVDDVARSLTFYRHLGFEFPPEAYSEPHVSLTMKNGQQVFWTHVDAVGFYVPDYTPSRHGRAGLGFQLDSPEEVDALFHKLCSLGYESSGVPWDAPWGHRYAVVFDPDGNLIDLFCPHT
jgi:catechol 2,3-dioxygenase-like lactoylglutathione lyase family enzyme